MRTITKTLTLPVGETSYDFRLTKLDALSGASLLRLIKKHLPAGGAETGASALVDRIFLALSDEELHSLMVSCLNHAEVLLDAGYQPVMTGPEWGWPEISHDPGTCLRLTLQEVLWSLQGFFGAGGSNSRTVPEASSR